MIGTDNEPVPANRAVADKASARGVELQLELTSSQVETTTGVTASSGELRDELLRRVGAEAAGAVVRGYWRSGYRHA